MRIGRAEASPSSPAAIFRRSPRGTIEFSSEGGTAASLQPELRDGPNSYNQGLAFDIGPLKWSFRASSIRLWQNRFGCFTARWAALRCGGDWLRRPAPSPLGKVA